MMTLAHATQAHSYQGHAPVGQNIGVLYAINGGVSLTGGSSFTGAVISGGVASKTVVGGGGDVLYSPGLSGLIKPFANGFTASTLVKWAQRK